MLMPNLSYFLWPAYFFQKAVRLLFWSFLVCKSALMFSFLNHFLFVCFIIVSSNTLCSGLPASDQRLNSSLAAACCTNKLNGVFKGQEVPTLLHARAAGTVVILPFAMDGLQGEIGPVSFSSTIHKVSSPVPSCFTLAGR